VKRNLHRQSIIHSILQSGRYGTSWFQGREFPQTSLHERTPIVSGDTNARNMRKTVRKRKAATGQWRVKSCNESPSCPLKLLCSFCRSSTVSLLLQHPL